MQIIEKTYKLNGSLKKRSKTDEIILHHAAAKNCTVEQIDSWHKQRGFTCIGYNFVVSKDGFIYRGRPEDKVGAHAVNHNSRSIGICAEGNFENEVMPDKQKQALKELVSYLKDKYGITKVLKHKDVSKTACPGKNYPFDEIANANVPQATNQANPTPATTSIPVAHVMVTCETLNIRAGAGTNYKIVAQAHKGGEYDVFEIKGDWGRINGGWFNLKYTSYSGNLKSNVTSEYYPKCNSKYFSIVSALESIGVDSSYSNRKKIATKNKIYDYKGSFTQNTQMLARLKAGKLLKI